MWIIALAMTALSALSSLLLPGNAVTFALMIPFLLFLPGYAVTRLLFNKKLDLDLFILTSIALSVVSSIIIGLILAVTPIGLSQITLLASVTALTFAAFVLDIYRHRENRHFEIVVLAPRKEDVDPVIAVAIAFGLVLIGIFSYIIVTTHPPSNTSVNLLSDAGDATMPNHATVGEDVNFTVVMKNGEGRVAEFKVMIYNNSALYNGTESPQNSYAATLDDRQTVERDFIVSFSVAGEQEVQARVFIDGEFYGELHFKVNVE